MSKTHTLNINNMTEYTLVKMSEVSEGQELNTFLCKQECL